MLPAGSEPKVAVTVTGSTATCESSQRAVSGLGENCTEWLASPSPPPPPPPQAASRATDKAAAARSAAPRRAEASMFPGGDNVKPRLSGLVLGGPWRGHGAVSRAFCGPWNGDAVHPLVQEGPPAPL